MSRPRCRWPVAVPIAPCRQRGHRLRISRDGGHAGGFGGPRRWIEGRRPQLGADGSRQLRRPAPSLADGPSSSVHEAAQAQLHHATFTPDGAASPPSNGAASSLSDGVASSPTVGASSSLPDGAASSSSARFRRPSSRTASSP
ncbi:hypothetical protein PR202_gb24508 [Eleusine coracana subsp. coracana]|uniref:Uncharacterized protein n=1 Tax=Eleusine coracana subsp. coracana TaxID=191504 RepID=A0AAV5FLT8_ELECO|nr:hypothetical protein PR202_gb24508 [Eleusine coracana subsp. coracana]